MMKYDVAIIGTQGIPARYSGFETLCQHLCEGLNDHLKIIIYCSSKNINKKEKINLSNVKRFFIPLSANGIQSIFYDYISIIHGFFNAKKLLILGVSGCSILPFLKILPFRKNIIVHLDGIEWQRDKWSPLASFILKISEFMAVKFSTSLITDNQGIRDYIKKAYGEKYIKKTKKLFYGGDFSQKSNTEVPIITKALNKEKITLKKNDYYLIICRAEPENNIEIILDCFRENKEKKIFAFCNWNVNKFGIGLLEKYSNYKNIFLLEPIYDRSKIRSIRQNAICYIHGHSVGGTNPSLVEAIGSFKPIFAFDVNFNRHTLFNKGYYWKDKEELKKLLMIEKNNLKLSADKNDNNSFFNIFYTWKKVVSSYKELLD